MLKRIAIVGLACTGLFALATTSASGVGLYRCGKVENAATEGRLQDGCRTTGLTNEYIRVRLGGTTFSATYECAMVRPGESGTWSGSACTEPGSEWVRVYKPRLGFTFTSGISLWRIPDLGLRLSCEKDQGEGVFSGRTLLIARIELKECEEIGAKEECTLKDFSTKLLNGLVGEVAEGEAKSKTGLLLEPATGKVIATVEETTCEPEANIEGSVAGEVESVNSLILKEPVDFTTKSSLQAIQLIVVEGKTIKPRLEAFAEPATLESTETDTIEEEIELT